jgi:dipeptidyl aminopeptidase/acylaminoacyl peptidase
MHARPSAFVPVLLALTLIAPAARSATPTRLIREDDINRFEWMGDPQISPDGTRIAFTRVSVDTVADDYRTRIWLIDVAGGAPRPLTAGPKDGQPRWSPDGKTLAFVRAVDGTPQIHLLPMTGGEPTALTKIKQGASSPAWSPDGKTIAFVSGMNPAVDDDSARAKPKHEPGRVVTRPIFRENGGGFIDPSHPDHIWAVAVGGGKPRQLTTGAHDEGAPQWSRDGKWVLFVSDRRDEPWFGYEDSDLYAVAPDLSNPTDGAALKTVIDIHGPVGSFTEDREGRIATIGNIQPEAVRSYDQDDLLLASGSWPRREVKNLTNDYDFDIGGGISADQHAPRGGGRRPLAFSADGSAILTVTARHGAAMLASVNTATGEVTELTDAKHEVIAGTCTPDAKHWALTMGDPLHMNVLCVYDADTRSLKKLWDPNEALFAGIRLGTVEEMWYSSFDGRRIQAWIVKPPDFNAKKKYPMILQIHGGPHAAYGMGFFHEFHLQAAAGYVVLYTNPRGSTSYGQEFGNIIQYRYPGDDYKDLMAGVDALLTKGYVDAKRMGVTGGSGGGLLTNWIVTQTHRFAAAVTQRCVSDWEAFYNSADFTLFTPTWFRKPPFEDPQEYLERSPVTYASRVETPLMIIHSEEDLRAPIEQGEAMFRALKQQHKVAVMIRFPNENHELSRSGIPSHRIQNQRHIRAWFDKYLLGKPIKEYDAPGMEARRTAQ